MDEVITMAHGAGGTQTARLIEKIFARKFDNPYFTHDDAAVMPAPDGKIAMTTDGFVVSPPFFPGGDVGKLSVCGTVNDLSCMGAKPLYLTCSFILEEGFAVSDVVKIADSMAKTADEAGVKIVAGDTKVVEKGRCGGAFITTAGVGQVLREEIGGERACVGDAVIITGDIGRHGCAVLLARGQYGIKADVQSDCAPLWGLTRAMLETGEPLHTIRDATRGGVGTVLNEIARQSNVCVKIDETSLPVRKSVSGCCGLLGLEPLYMACEGRMVVIAPQAGAQKLLEAIRSDKYGKDAAIIGRVTDNYPGRVIISTALGGQRMLPPPGGELLPRIC